MQSTRDATASDVSLEAHRVWRLFTPDCNPSITFVLARAATEGVSSEFIEAAHSRILEPRYFHSNAGRGYVWNPTVSTRSPDTPNHPPHDGHAIAGDTAPSHLDSAPYDDSAPLLTSAQPDDESQHGAHDGGGTSWCPTPKPYALTVGIASTAMVRTTV